MREQGSKAEDQGEREGRWGCALFVLWRFYTTAYLGISMAAAVAEPPDLGAVRHRRCSASAYLCSSVPLAPTEAWKKLDIGVEGSSSASPCSSGSGQARRTATMRSCIRV